MQNYVEIISSDFDGVYPPNSDAVHKRQAWDIVMAPWAARYKPYFGEANKLFGNGKPGGRNEILRYMFERLGCPANEVPELIETAARQFNEYVQKKILEDGLTPGALDMLQGLRNLGVTMYLNSGTATPALVEAARGLKIDHYFREMLGSTPEPVGGSKVDNLKYIARKHPTPLTCFLVIGDGDSDVEAARELGCRFLGIANQWNRWAVSKPGFDYVTDLREVLHYV